MSSHDSLTGEFYQTFKQKNKNKNKLIQHKLFSENPRGRTFPNLYDEANIILIQNQKHYKENYKSIFLMITDIKVSP